MTPKDLQLISKDLKLLYVEDDKDLREETSKLFSHLFESVDLAEDGAVGLEKYKNGTYDIIVTDINMPRMNGVDMVKAIKEINPTQTIIVTSAHDESQYLLPLIDAGVDKYILKPINMQNLMTVLGSVCSYIQNEQLISAYRKELEESNETLVKTVSKLEKMVRILDTKIKQENIVSKKNHQAVTQASSESQTTQNNDTVPKTESTPTEQAAPTPEIQRFDDYILDNDMAELKELEEEIDATAVILQLQSSVNEQQVVDLGKNFKNYGSILSNYPIFGDLGHSIIDMGAALVEHSQTYCEKSAEISTLLESFFYVLSKWRNAIFEEGVTDPHMYDASLINDMETIVMILENKQDEIESEIEFF